MKDRSNMIWIDLEMTGLDTQRDYIIEIASIVTDKNLNIISNFIDGKIANPKSSNLGNVFDPSKGEIISKVILSKAQKLL